MYDSQIGLASEMKDLAITKSYLYESEAAAIGALIKTAARAGELKVVYQSNIDKPIQEALIEKGYKLRRTEIGVNTSQYTISWE